MESRSFGGSEVRCVRLESLLDFGRSKLLNLLRGTTHKGAGVEKGVELAEDGAEECSAADAVEKVVVLAVLLDVVGGLVRKDA